MYIKKLVKAKGYEVWEVKTLSLQHCALCKIHVAERQTMLDQITSERKVHTRVNKLRYVHSIHS